MKCWAALGLALAPVAEAGLGQVAYVHHLDRIRPIIARASWHHSCHVIIRFIWRKNEVQD